MWGPVVPCDRHRMMMWLVNSEITELQTVNAESFVRFSVPGDAIRGV